MRNPLLTFLGLTLLLLAACGADRPLRKPGQKAPAMWLVEKDDLHAHIFGTIHVLPDNVAWQTQKMKDAQASSDRLVLEATGLDDQAGSQAIFKQIGQSPGLPPIEQRIPANRKAQYEQLVKNGDFSPATLKSYESWAAALILSTAAQGAAGASGSNGVEASLISDFKAEGKAIDGLETVAEQFGIFDALPEAVQRQYLVATIDQTKDAHSDFSRLVKAWISGDQRRIERDVVSEIAPQPELASALLYNRNAHWADEIADMHGRPFIAVGAAHLAGRDNLIAKLQARGFKVTRVQ